MRPTGFSTGAVSKGDFEAALALLTDSDSDAVELSALRESELVPLLAAIKRLALSRYRYRSIHAPKSFSYLTERETVGALRPFALEGFMIVVHPDVIHDFEAWRSLGSSLCLENMDMSKSTGRTPEEFDALFRLLPDARLCLDLGHARQVDPSMSVANRFVSLLGDRIAAIHASEVDSAGEHWSMSALCLGAFSRFAARLDSNVAVILESQVPASGLTRELEHARRAFSPEGTSVCNGHRP